MAKRTQNWTPDTHPELSISQEWDDAVPAEERTFKCVKVVITENGSVREITDPVECKKIHDETTGLNQHKNGVIVPAMLAALSDNEKTPVKDVDGSIVDWDFIHRPNFRVRNGEIVADMDHLPAAIKTKLTRVLSKHAKMK